MTKNNLFGKIARDRMCGNCYFYEPDYSTWCFNGWTGDGSIGYCCVEPRKVTVLAERIACHYFMDK